MSATLSSLQHKISSAEDLQSVVRTMKAMAVASIGQYEKSVQSLDEYYRAIELGLLACFRQQDTSTIAITNRQVDNLKNNGTIVFIVFGSDQGLVGPFNDVTAQFVIAESEKFTREKNIWAIGERIRMRLAETVLPIVQHFALPNSIAAITSLVGEILLALENGFEQGDISEVYLFHNQPQSDASYHPSCVRLLPLDNDWRTRFIALSWPNKNLPEVINGRKETLLAFVHEYLFVSLFRTCAESLASENASRLLAMQRAEKNINELLDVMQHDFHRLRQSRIDEELFDVVAGSKS